MNILLIDDDADDCMFLNHGLAMVSDHITMKCKLDVDHLFEAINLSKPSLIFIDYYMPKRSGLDCLRQIKSHSENKHIPVIMWSTSHMRNQVVAAYREGHWHLFKSLAVIEN